MSEERRARLLAALLAGAGATHFLLPRPYDEIVPHALPGSPRSWTLVSGAAELVVGALVARRSTRRLGAGLAALLFVVVFPGNVQMAWDWRDDSWPRRLAAYGRLPLQVPLVVWALRVRRSVSDSASAPSA